MPAQTHQQKKRTKPVKSSAKTETGALPAAVHRFASAKLSSVYLTDGTLIVVQRPNASEREVASSRRGEPMAAPQQFSIAVGAMQTSSALLADVATHLSQELDAISATGDRIDRLNAENAAMMQTLLLGS